MICSICDSIQSVGFLTDIRESAYTYPIILATHLSCIAVFGGLIVMTDLRLLGAAMKKYSVSAIIQQTRPWKWLGFIIMVTCGLLLAGSKLSDYYKNPYFRVKIALLILVGVHALIFRPKVYTKSKAVELDRLPVIPGRAKAAAYLSLVLWASIMVMGRMIGYYEPKNTQSASVASQTVSIPSQVASVPSRFVLPRK